MRAKKCRSELARENLKDAAFIQNERVIVNDLREQARSYRGWGSFFSLFSASD